MLGKNSAEANLAYGQMLGIGRSVWSMPPDHAAACVRIVLADDDLRSKWQDELETVRRRMLSLRTGFAEALRRQSNSDRFDFIAHQRGMFSRLGITGDQVKRLRDGSRRTTNITEVIGMEGDVIVTQELFKFEYLDETEDGKIIGEFRPSGLRPYTLEKARQFGFDQAYLEACL